MSEVDASPIRGRSSVKHDGRKHYPSGTRGAVTIEAETNEPQTRARGELFAKIVGDTLTEARALLEVRLREAGFTDLNVWIDTGQTDLGYWFDASVAVDVYELRNADA
jgi:hypothetical protein